MSDVLTKWNNEVLLDSNRKTEFALEVIGKIISNISVEKNSKGDLVFSLKNTDKLNKDLMDVEDRFLNNAVPRLSAQSFNYVNVINDCIPVLNKAVKNVINTTSLSVDDMVDLIQALGINYTSHSGTGGGSGGGSSSSSSSKSEKTSDEVNVPDDLEKPVTGTLDEKGMTVETENGITKVSLKEDNVILLIEELTKTVKKLKEERKVQLVLEISDAKDLNLSVSIPSKAISKLLENNIDLIIKSDDIEYNIPADAINNEDILKDAVLEIKSREINKDEAKAINEIAEKEGNVAKILDFSLQIDSKKEVKSLTKFNNYIVLKINVKGLGDQNKLGIYYLNEETKELEFVSGKIRDNKLIMRTNHFSKYAIIEFNKQFTDIAGNWAKYYIESMAAKHVVNGYPDGTFKPNQEITRLEMASLLSKLVKNVDVKDTEIEDILRVYIDEREIPKWARVHVARVSKAGLMIGNKDNRFVPNGKTTRAEAATAIYRLYDKY
ncbi:S-layer homology domain-containing protein [Caloranaerobacter azorensis]|uniref:S-layer homology domain-containing protein n=1 Tax=Caloranaerobacter azorensis TaxID=116090 RepID=A0A6P1YI74_9FIRM|nr:S-layer homology domain-containing protein [Caloranaerobacter azorensis]QIB27566.1 S-layer homology domain-containing protein [Caloranaerobacter azorensis]